VEDFSLGLRAGLETLRSVFFRPNILFLTVKPDADETALQFCLDLATENNMGAILYARHPEALLGHEQIINVWIRDQSPAWEVGLRLTNLDLSLLLAYQLAHNWRGRINLITIVSDADERANGEKFLADLMNYGRMPRHTQAIVEMGPLEAYLPQAPQADLNIFGLQDRVDRAFIERMLRVTDASCIFVRDSGDESALA